MCHNSIQLLWNPHIKVFVFIFTMYLLSHWISHSRLPALCWTVSRGAQEPQNSSFTGEHQLFVSSPLSLPATWHSPAMGRSYRGEAFVPFTSKWHPTSLLWKKGFFLSVSPGSHFQLCRFAPPPKSRATLNKKPHRGHSLLSQLLLEHPPCSSKSRAESTVDLSGSI